MMLLRDRKSARLKSTLIDSIDAALGGDDPFFAALLVEFYEARVRGRRVDRSAESMLEFYSASKNPEHIAATQAKWEALKK